MPIVIPIYDDGSGNLIHSWQGLLVAVLIIAYVIQIVFVIGFLIADYPQSPYSKPYFRSKSQFLMHCIPFLWPIMLIISAIVDIGKDRNGKPQS